MKWLLSRPFFLPLFLIPALAVLFSLHMRHSGLQELKDEIEEMEGVALHLQTKPPSSIQTPGPLYLKQETENLALLESETHRLQAILFHQPEKPLFAERLAFLKSGKNMLSFVETKREKTAEVELGLKTAVELDEEDLKKALVIVEGVTVNPYSPKEGRPPLLIQDFDLKKKQTVSQEEIFVVDMKLLTREKL